MNELCPEPKGAELHQDSLQRAIASEDGFRNLLDKVPQIVWMMRLDGQAEFFSQRWVEYTGLTLEQSRGSGWQSVVHPEDLRCWLVHWPEARHSAKSLEIDMRLRRTSDGAYRWHLARSIAFKEANGQEFKWLGTFTDIHEHKRFEDELRASEAKFRGFVESAPDAMLIANAEGKIILVNTQTERLFAYPREELLNQPVEMLLPERFRQRHVEHRSEYAAQPRARPMGVAHELFGRRKDGSEFPAEISLSPLKTEEGVVVSCAIRDITDRKAAEDALKRTAAELTRSNADLEQFAYVASHDLQEPLRVVASAAQLLARDFGNKLGPEADEYITYVVRGAKRMQVLINELLNYSRLGTQRMPFEPVNCEQVCQRAITNLKVAIEESAAEVNLGPLPVVMGDRNQLLQLFQNLLSNAIKFRSQAPPSIQVEAKPREGVWEFAIRDNGIGIDAQQFSRLFVIFQRLHGREEYPGSGVSLAVSKKIVEQHGGRIWVESELGKGATFHFTIPRAK